MLTRATLFPSSLTRISITLGRVGGVGLSATTFNSRAPEDWGR